MSFSVPGLVDGWIAAHEKYGTLQRSELFAAAIDLADNGFPVSHVLSGVIASDSLLCEFPSSQAIFAPGGKPMQPGEILYQKDLAKTFRAILDGCMDAFYKGDIAKAIVNFSD